MLPSDIRSLAEAYQSIYAQEEIVELTEELLDESFDELVEELIEEGYEEEEAISLLEDATDDYLDEAKVTFGHDTTARRASGAPVGARRKYGKRKAGEALKAAGSAVKGAADSAKKKAAAAKAGVQIAGSIAKDEARRAGRKAVHGVKHSVEKKKQEVKSGIKGFLGKAARKVASKAAGAAARLGEEAIQEADSIAAMRERAAKRRKQRYGASDTSRGGRDDFRPYTKADYERGEANDPRKKDQKEEFEIDEARAMGSARSGDQNPKGSQVRVSSGRGMTMTPARGLGASKPKGDDAKRKAKYDAQAKADRRAAARDRAAEGEDRVGRLIRKVQREELEATGLFSKKELDGMFEQMTTQTQIPPVGDSLKPGNPNAAPKPVKLPPPTAKKKPEPKLGAGTPGFGYGVGTGP